MSNTTCEINPRTGACLRPEAPGQCGTPDNSRYEVCSWFERHCRAMEPSSNHALSFAPTNPHTARCETTDGQVLEVITRGILLPL